MGESNTAARMKGLAPRAGVLDLFCGWSGGAGLEQKSKKGQAAFAQKVLT